MTRRCSRCREIKDASEFRKGHRCRECERTYKRKWSRDNHEMALATGRRFRARHPKKAVNLGICHITQAFAERFGATEGAIRRVGTLQLCLCKSDEARRILISACMADLASAKKANRASQIVQKVPIALRRKKRPDVDRMIALAFGEKVA